MAKSVKRPALITFIGVFGIIIGVARIIAGLAIAFSSDKSGIFKNTELSTSEVIWVGAVLVALGAFVVFLANSLLSGQKWAQIWYGVVTTINLVAGLIVLIGTSGVARWEGLFAAVVSFIILQVLFSERAQAYFED